MGWGPFGPQGSQGQQKRQRVKVEGLQVVGVGSWRVRRSMRTGKSLSGSLAVVRLGGRRVSLRS